MESQTNRRCQHFSRVLNVRSTFTPDVVASIPQMDCDHSLSLPPTRLELLQAISQCKNGKAAVPTFRYLGCNITNDGRCCADVKARIAQAAKVFGTLKRPIFLNCTLNLNYKRSVFNACVLSTLLYGAECWIILQADLYALTSFFHRCVRSILGARKKDVWQDRISNAVLLDRWGDSQSMEHRIHRCRLEWLGHMARMEDDRIPKALLFGSFPG